MREKTRRAAPEAISIQVAAAVLCVSEDTIRRRIKRGEIEAVKFGKLWRIPKDVVSKLRRRRDAGEPLVDPGPVASDQFRRDVERLAAVLLEQDEVRRVLTQRLQRAAVPMHT